MTERPPILVTGASTGIGRAAAIELDRRGLRVLAGVRREADASSLRGAGSSRLAPVMLDVTDASSIGAALEGVGALGGVVNNAGIVVAGPLEALEPEWWREQFDVNVLGAVRVTHACLPLLHAGRGLLDASGADAGAPVRVVNVGSIASRIALPFMGPYAGTKHALSAITDSLRGEIRPFGLDAVLLEPGSVRTPIWDKSIASAEARLTGVDPARGERYRVAIEKLGERAARSGAHGVAPDLAGRVIARLLTARRVRTRTLLGTDARLLALIWARMPRRVRDRLAMRALS